MHETIKKSIKNTNESSSSSVLDPEACQICKHRYESPEDIDTDSHGLTGGIRKAVIGGSTQLAIILVVYNLGVQLGSKNQTRKIDKIHKDFEL